MNIKMATTAKSEIETDHLLTIRNYARKFKVTSSYIYKLIKEEKIVPTIIDGVQFIDKEKYKLPVELFEVRKLYKELTRLVR